MNAQITKGAIPKIEIQSKEDKKSVVLESINTEVEIFGNISKTTSTMIFKNNANRVLEGQLVFPLPDKTTISGYAIDINGKLRNAVPIEKERATEVFESIQKQNVDPGIIEKVEGNNFKTRISPIPANGTRTIQISYYQTLNLEQNNYLYVLPLNTSEKISKFDLVVKVYQSTEKPKLIEKPDNTFKFSENSNIYEASLSKVNFKPSNSLIIELPKSENSIESFTQKNTDGSMYFLSNLIINGKTESKIWSDNLGIIWDNSLSRLNQDHEKELELLGKIIKQQKNITIDVVLLNIQLEKGKTFQIKNGDWTDLKQYLKNTVYDGATNYSIIEASKLPANEYLMFSDGISTIGSNQFNFNKPIYTVTASAKSNFGILKIIAQKNKGKFINLAENSVDKGFITLNESNVQFLGIQNQEVTEVYPVIGTEITKDFSVTGICPSNLKKLTLAFGRNGKVLFTKEINLEKASNGLDVSKIWAQNKVDFLEMDFDGNKDDIAEIGKQFSIVTANTSLIVLENVSDYVKYKILPPDELLVAYNDLMKNQTEENEYQKNNLLDEAFTTVEDLRIWWNTNYEQTKKKYPKPEKLEEPPTPLIGVNRVSQDETISEITAIAPSNDSSPVRESRSVSYSTAETLDYQAEESEPMLEEIVIDTYRTTSRRRSESKTNKSKNSDKKTVSSDIKTFDVKSDKDYIKKIEKSKNPYETYLTLRKEYQETPSFYYDVATFFFQKKESETGYKVLSSIAELGLENAEMYKTLAYKLKEIGAYDTELFVTEKVLKWRPFDAQSYRDYALALQDNQRYQEALDFLYQTLTNSYDENFRNRDRNISEIIIPEINNLISVHGKKLDLSKIDKKLILDIPVDIRVVMNWNKDDTDIDLYVTDPNGDVCFYSHRATEIGGRMSDDVTRGFGPEQFMLKKAIKGKYKIESNFYGESQMTLSGPTTISVEIYLMYSSGKEVRKLITFQNDKPNSGKDKILIGEFEF